MMLSLGFRSHRKIAAFFSPSRILSIDLLLQFSFFSLFQRSMNKLPRYLDDIDPNRYYYYITTTSTTTTRTIRQELLPLIIIIVLCISYL